VERAGSPKILRISWGEMEAEEIGRGKDLKLWPGGGRAWDWSETGTHHVPGIQRGDVQELLDHGSDVIVLSRGQELQLETSPSTIELLQELGTTFHVQETRAAVRTYNDLADQGIRVGGLFHSTC
jgi:hypothetical protein